MSLVDDIFSSIPAPLIDQFGIDMIYVKASQNQTYDPTTGMVSGFSTEIPIKGVIAELRPEELQGLYQQSDVKIIIAASSLNGYYPQMTDLIKYNQAGTQRTAKITGQGTVGRGTFSYRGDNPILHVVFARLS
jgi:hypothetical protein